MSITNDVRAYADSAREQAQARLTGARGDAADLASTVLSRASVTYAELRTRGGALTKQVSELPGVERATTTAEPYVAQLKGYGSSAAQRLEQVYAELRKNDQIAKVFGVAETAIDALQERVTSLLDQQPTASTATAKAHGEAKPAAKVDGRAEPAGTASAAKSTPAAKRTTPGRATKA